MNSPINYFGGKGTMFKNIIEQFPAPESYDTYIEPFGGSYSVGIKMPYIPSNEIYNDLEENVYSLFKTLSDPSLFENFKRLADLTPYSEQIRDDYVNELETNGNLSIDQRAWMFYYVNKTSFNGVSGFTMNLTVRRNMSKSVSTYLSSVDSLLEFHQRLSHMIISHRDGISLIEKYKEKENVFIYADPPYVQSTRSNARYKVDMTDDIQERFINACINAKCKILISGYKNDLYKRLEDNGFNRIDFPSKVFVNGGESQDRIESLWKNY